MVGEGYMEETVRDGEVKGYEGEMVEWGRRKG